jgi:hypothetical protein
LLKEAWEHAEKLESLAGKLAQLDQELIAVGISMEKEQHLDQTQEDVVEIDALDDVVDESTKESASTLTSTPSWTILMNCTPRWSRWNRMKIWRFACLYQMACW